MDQKPTDEGQLQWVPPTDIGDEKPKEEEPQESMFDRMLNLWWGKSALGVFICAVTYWIYCDLTRLENGEVESLWMTRRLGALYETFGKWPVVSALGLIGAGMIGWGLWQFAVDKKKV